MRVLIVTLLVFACTTLTYGAEPSAKDAEIAKLKAENAELKREVVGLKANIKILKTQLKRALKISEHVAELEAQVIRLKTDIAPPTKLEPKPKPKIKVLTKWKGFRGVAWGQDIKTLKGMTLVGRERRTLIYERNIHIPDYKYGGFKTRKIRFVFEGGKFTCGRIYYNGLRAFESLKETAFVYYGKGHKTGKRSYIWSSVFTPKLNCGNAEMTLEFDSTSYISVLQIWSN